jgi:hypothetical protein
VEVAGDLVDEYEAAQFASLFIIEGLNSLIHDLLGLSSTLRRIPEIGPCFKFGINFNVLSIINMVDYAELFSIFVKSVLMELALNVNNVDAGYIHNIERKDVARAFGESDVKVDVEFFFA